MSTPHSIQLLLLLSLTACGPKPGATTEGSGAPLAAEAPSDSQTIATSESPQSADPAGALKAALAVVGTRKLYIEEPGNLMLFADERLAAQSIIAQWASAVGFSVIDPQLVHTTLQQAALGKHPTSGEACGLPLDRQWATNRWLPQLGAAGHFKVDVYCQPECTLQLRLQLDRQGTEFFAAPFDPAVPWQEALHRSLRLLRDNGGHGQHGHLNNPVAVQGIKRSSELGDWIVDEADMQVAPQSFVDQAVACGAQGGGRRLLVETSAEGKLRCEGLDSIEGSPVKEASVTSCLCSKVEGSGAARRSVLAVLLPEGEASAEKTKSGLDLRATIFKSGLYSDEPWTERMFFADCQDESKCSDVAECFVERTEPVADLRLGLTLSFDKSGAATRAAIADFQQQLRPKEHACVVARLMRLGIPCPDAPSSTRKAKLDLRIEQPTVLSP